MVFLENNLSCLKGFVSFIRIFVGPIHGVVGYSHQE